MSCYWNHQILSGYFCLGINTECLLSWLFESVMTANRPDVFFKVSPTEVSWTYTLANIFKVADKS